MSHISVLSNSDTEARKHFYQTIITTIITITIILIELISMLVNLKSLLLLFF